MGGGRTVRTATSRTGLMAAASFSKLNFPCLSLGAVESPSTMFGTTMNYVALRLLGMGADHPVCRDGRKFIQDQGGALMTSSWAKFTLCMLGCMHWDGHNSVPPGTRQ